MDIKTYAVVLAAGRGTRMRNSGNEMAKQFRDLKGYPVLFYSLKAFENSRIDGIIIVTSNDMIDYVRTEIIDRYSIKKCVSIVEGGNERFDSVFNGLKACTSESPDYVMIHDGARPLISPDMINMLIKETVIHNAVVAACKSKDTIKLADDEEYVISTPDRRQVWSIQTPQSFRYELIFEAYKIADADGSKAYTDDASVAESMKKQKIKLVDCGYTNLKITTSEDFIIVERLLETNCYN